MSPRKPWIAFVLSALIPGAGLCYLDRWRWGVLNFIVAQVFLLVCAFWPFDRSVIEYYHYLVLAVAAASGGVAHAVATGRFSRRSMSS